MRKVAPVVARFAKAGVEGIRSGWVEELSLSESWSYSSSSAGRSCSKPCCSPSLENCWSSAVT